MCLCLSVCTCRCIYLCIICARVCVVCGCVRVRKKERNDVQSEVPSPWDSSQSALKDTLIAVFKQTSGVCVCVRVWLMERDGAVSSLVVLALDS